MNYTMEFKREAIEYAEKNSNHEAAETFHVVVKQVREWRKNKLKIFEPTVKPKNKRLEGGGQLVMGENHLENQLVEWIYDRISNGVRVSRKFIMVKAKHFYENERFEGEKSLSVASNWWVNNFISVMIFRCLVKQKQPTARQDHERLIYKLILHILRARRFSIKYKYPLSRLKAMGEICVWNDMVSNTTIDKERNMFV